MLSLVLAGLMVVSGGLDSSAGAWLAYLCLCAAVVFAIYQIPGSCGVQVGIDGISIRSPFWKQRLDWRNLKGFVLVDLNGDRPDPSPRRCWIGYLMSDSQREATSAESLRIFEPLGCDGLLPRVEDVDSSELVRLLNGVLRHQRGSVAGTED